MENTKKVNEELIEFWNSAISLSNEFKEQIKEEIPDYKELAPSLKLFDAAKELGNCKKVLDYGCGSGWASIIAAKSGCRDVLSVDLGQNIIDTINFYARLYEVDDKLHASLISADWLSTVDSDLFDGFICSNVLDVVPIETSESIIKEISRIVTKDAKIIIGLNFYLSNEQAKSRDMELVDGKYLFVNGVLRLTSLSDDEWSNTISKYFDVIKIDHFAWPGEKSETRRLFFLKRK